MTELPRLKDLVPAGLAPVTRRIFLNGYDVPVDIGFHDFEIGTPQRLIINAEVLIDEASFAASNSVSEAWNYDFLRSEIGRLAAARRYNLQETLVRAIYDSVAARAGVVGVRISACKPDVYPDCEGVGVELSSF